MRNPLIKKQFMEMFKSYFVNQKTGEKRSKAKTIGLFVLFAFLMIIISASIFGMTGLLVGLLKADREIHWLFFAVMGIIAIFLGVFGSVFNTYASLYLAKDNELLLSLPISPQKILFSRIIGVYGLSLLYGGIVWIPACIMYFIFGRPGVAAIIFDVLLLFIIALFVTVLTLILGFVVAALSLRLKNKSYITVIITLAAIGGYYFVWFRMTETLKNIVNNYVLVGKSIKKWGNLFYVLGKASTGDVLFFLLFTAISAVLFAVSMFVLSKTFIRIATMNKGTKSEKAKIKSGNTVRKVASALLSKEFKRFTSSSLYMLNCALATVIAPIVAIAVIIKKNSITEIIPAIRPMFNIDAYLPVLVAAIVSAIIGMNSVTAPSISLEGKNLWILKSLPVSAADIYKAKINLHLLLTAPIGILSAAVIGFTLKLSAADIVCICVLIFVLTVFEAGFGLMINIKRPDFSWTNETTPIKQSLNILIYMFVCFIIPVIIVGGFFLVNLFIKASISPTNYLLVIVFAFAIISRFLNGWIYKKGVDLFDEFAV